MNKLDVVAPLIGAAALSFVILGSYAVAQVLRDSGGSSPIVTSNSGVSIGTIASGTSGQTWTTTGSTTIAVAPNGSVYHQVVDVYYDAAGQKIEAKSATHLVNGDCSRGRRPDPSELIAQDDGKGNVRFTSLLLASEPASGQKPVTAQDRVKALLAAKRSPHIPETPVAQRPTNLALTEHDIQQ